jgi:hypothetical protein
MPDDCCPTLIECVGGGPRDGERYEVQLDPGWYCDGKALWDASMGSYVLLQTYMEPTDVKIEFVRGDDAGDCP